MTYKNIIEGKFLSRHNRFVAKVAVNDEEVFVHVKNTGRCKELLVEGATVFLEDFRRDIGNRKYAYSLVAVEKLCSDTKKILINMDSQAPNKVVCEALQKEILRVDGIERIRILKPEAVYGKSRLDFYVKDYKDNEAYIEVKGVTLEDSGVAYFPDAPTLRGIKHLKELSEIAKKGFKACVLFVVQFEEVNLFKPNADMHKEFADALKSAKENGVEILAYKCKVTKNSLELYEKIEVNL